MNSVWCTLGVRRSLDLMASPTGSDDYQRAADLAHETDRAIETWTRWRRRFAPDPDRLELGSGRVNVRYEISRALFEQRNELVRLLTEPAPASA
jgi:hypothetical protein